MRIESGEKLLFIGDSITDCGRVRPHGEGPGQAVGTGYVSLVKALLAAAYPERRIRVVNRGIGGNTVRGLEGRWEDDVLRVKPDWLSVMIGINDVWRAFDCAEIPGRAVTLDRYRETLDRLLAGAREALALKGLVLMSPFYIEPNPEEPLRAAMDRYGAAVRELAAAHGASFVDVQAAFDRLLQHRHPTAIAGDRVHPDLTGHAVIARAFLETVGYAW
jgi:lysophospholipase L1-like esterase